MYKRQVHDLIKEYATEHQKIVFNGNGYSEEWVKEAERRGLPNLPSMVDAIPALVADKNVEMFEKFHVFTRAEDVYKRQISSREGSPSSLWSTRVRGAHLSARKDILPGN